MPHPSVPPTGVYQELNISLSAIFADLRFHLHQRLRKEASSSSEDEVEVSEYRRPPFVDHQRHNSSRSDKSDQDGGSSRSQRQEMSGGELSSSSNEDIDSDAKPSRSRKNKALRTLQTTISDDISRGSEFDQRKRKLKALRQSAIDAKHPFGITPGSRTRPFPNPPPPPTGRRGVRHGAVSVPTHVLPPNLNQRNFGEYQTDGIVDEIKEDRSLNDALRLVRRHFDIRDESLLTIDSLRKYASMVKAIRPKAQLIHRVWQPQWSTGQSSRREALVGTLPVHSVSSYVSKHPEIICVVYRDYDGSPPGPEDSTDNELIHNKLSEHTRELIEPISNVLVRAIDAFCDCFDFAMDKNSTKGAILSCPYLPIYHTRGNSLRFFLDTRDETQREQFQVFLDHILTGYDAEYDFVDSMTREGNITSEYVRYLFRPGDILVQGKSQSARGYLCTDWPKQTGPEKKEPHQRTLGISVSSWKFDGIFSQESVSLTLKVDFEDLTAKSIYDMDIRPLSFADNTIKERLKSRGRWFWICRTRHMVSYNQEAEHMFQSSGHGRYMIDMKMYQELHKSKGEIDFYTKTKKVILESVVLEHDDPPDDNFLYTTPLTIKGFDLKRKKWLDLYVDKIGPVAWNKQAFKHLVIKNKTKRLIQALISNQIEAEKSTDLITGKGNGLIMLLHGGPGTGKTLTAERPLYPVTCGDIGTKPEEVEQYLESVLHIGKTWGCVVLLDEADVFLEQRRLDDLQRNALVSVFLRVLEYYDGILILTSNRVGTFDEAFKSRIQLALHYKNLSEDQRTEIWRNFLSRLEDINEEGIDFVDLKDNIKELAKHRLNGREIRNVITTARQYARWEQQQPKKSHVLLDLKMMQEVIETAGEFDSYIEKLNGGLTHDQLAEEDGYRLGDGA
ncbi:hypothetical protein F4808DRAFT_472240 [Astrocystis sublimbata]|nr:hypothetical protein F4808DRAFT_472240 [Astrocystis sublimbata]